MRSLVVTLLVIAGGGCAIQRNSQPVSTGRPEPVDQDVELATSFLNALLRPDQSEFRVTVDAYSDESMRHIPVATRNQQLQERLALLRKSPGQAILVNIYSADLPKPWGSGHHLYAFDTGSGKLAERGMYEVGSDNSDMWLRIDH